MILKASAENGAVSSGGALELLLVLRVGAR